MTKGDQGAADIKHTAAVTGSLRQSLPRDTQGAVAQVA